LAGRRSWGIKSTKDEVEQLVADVLGDAEASGGVLHVGDAVLHIVLLEDLRQGLPGYGAARAAHDVADDQDVHARGFTPFLSRNEHGRGGSLVRGRAAGQMLESGSPWSGAVVDINERLLGLVAATSWDGGEALLKSLARILREMGPYEAGEVVLVNPEGLRRWPLAGRSEPFAGETLLRHTASRDSPMRADDLSDLHRYPETRRRMSELGFRSPLGVPLSSAGGPQGALVLSGRHGWAFAGVASRDLLPIAGMTGLCLERALALTTLRSELERLDAKRDEDSPTNDTILHAEIQRLRAELATTSSECEALRAEMEQLRAAAKPKPVRRRKRKPKPAVEPASPGTVRGEGS
jgi:GAF domain-containing protein